MSPDTSQNKGLPVGSPLEMLQEQLRPLLDRCVECGFCLPHCATWHGTGNEAHSPRGRLMLLSELIDQSSPDIPTGYLEAFDGCIGCRACETACPGGVPFTLLENGQELATARLKDNAGLRQSLPGGSFVLRNLDSTTFLRLIGLVGGAAKNILSLFWGSSWRKKLDRGPGRTMVRLLGTMPCSPGSDQELRLFLADKCGQTTPRWEANPVAQAAVSPAGETKKPRVVFFSGCANAGLLPATSARLLALLRAAGCEVTTTSDQECCGALAAHTGRPGRASALRRKNLAVMDPHLAGDSVILVEAAGCGLEFKEKYGEEFAARVTDAAVLLSRLDLPPLGEVPLKVVYHDPCHARHGQGIVDEPRAVLRQIPGLQLLEPMTPEVCCGSGGAWGLNHPDLSSRLGRRKAAELAATGAELVITSNPGCQGQISDGLALEAPGLSIMPLSDLLWYAWQAGAR